MKLKRTDLELLMQYLAKERPEVVEVVVNDIEFKAAIAFAFKDTENRDCIIRLHDASHSTTPDLVKTMKLYSRVSPSKVTASPSSGGSQGEST